MSILKKCLLSFLLIFTAQVHASILQNNPETLTLTIVNHTSSMLSFAGIDHSQPGNTFQLGITEILPGGSSTLTATSNALFGITANLYFRDNQGNKNLLTIKDPRQLNTKSYGDFAMNNERFVSFVKMQSVNRDPNPNSLTWTAATIEIEDKINV
ncbi:MAG: hypothetical protein SFW66_09390 [Gammaproteobacteria bacterium]|nr:hypothetical protein [Gammaproteobacteria bacterium]